MSTGSLLSWQALAPFCSFVTCTGLMNNYISQKCYTVTPMSPRISDSLWRLAWRFSWETPGEERCSSWRALMYSSSENCFPRFISPLRISCTGKKGKHKFLKGRIKMNDIKHDRYPLTGWKDNAQSNHHNCNKYDNVKQHILTNSNLSIT